MSGEKSGVPGKSPKDGRDSFFLHNFPLIISHYQGKIHRWPENRKLVRAIRRRLGNAIGDQPHLKGVFPPFQVRGVEANLKRLDGFIEAGITRNPKAASLARSFIKS